jgi:hypothetical protein
MPKDTVEFVITHIKRNVLWRDNDMGLLETHLIDLVTQALTTAYNKGVEVGGVKKLEEVGNFVDELYQSGNMGDNEHAFLLDYFNEELGTPTPLPEKVSL